MLQNVEYFNSFICFQLLCANWYILYQMWINKEVYICGIKPQMSLLFPQSLLFYQQKMMVGQGELFI